MVLQEAPTPSTKEDELPRLNTKNFNMLIYQNIKRIKTNEGVNDREKVKMALEAMMPKTPATYRRNGLGWLTGKKRRAMIDENGTSCEGFGGWGIRDGVGWVGGSSFRFAACR